MCGIAGIISPLKDLSGIVQDMCEAIRRRGPDGQGFYFDEQNGVYLGHNRLSIIDLSESAKQPIFNEDRTVLAIVNGEIYNFIDLRNELLQKGHRFCSRCDSEAVVHAYEEWGEDFVSHLQGMFAIAVWDLKEKKLLLTRDHLGIKPLYYFATSQLFSFASEAKTFLRLKDLYTPEINLKAVELLLAYSFILDNEMTAFRDIYKLPAGHMLVFKGGKYIIKEYWRLTCAAGNSLLSFEDACVEFEEKILGVIKLHLQSDVKAGVLLSGGVDSSFVASLAAKISPEPIDTFTASFRHSLDEAPYARQAAGHLRLRHTSFMIDPKIAGVRIEEIVNCFDDLSFIDGGLVTTYLMAEKIKESGIKVVLSGEGADEIFGGYPWFALGCFPLRLLPVGARNLLYYNRITKNLFNKYAFYGIKSFYNLLDDVDEGDAFRRLSRFEICHQLPNSFLMKVDKGAMAHGLEVRVPYLDREIVEFVDRLPSSFKRNIFTDKRILRKVAGKYLPAQIVSRKKRGFLLPISDVLNANKGKVRDYVLSANSLARRFFDCCDIEGLLDFSSSCPPLLSKARELLLWKLFILEVWKSEFITGQKYHQRTVKGHIV